MIHRITSKFIPKTELEIQYRPDGLYYVVVKMDGQPDHPAFAYQTMADAETGLEKMKRDLNKQGEKLYREHRKHHPLKQLTREELQDYLLQMDDTRASHFLEGTTTLTYLSLMLSYQLDEAENVWDESIPKVLRTRLDKAIDAVDKLLDALLSAHLLGENDEGYELLSKDSYRFLDVVNAMCNFCRPIEQEEFRLVAIENALQRSLPTETVEQIRKERAENLFQTVREDLLSKRELVKK